MVSHNALIYIDVYSVSEACSFAERCLESERSFCSRRCTSPHLYDWSISKFIHIWKS